MSEDPSLFDWNNAETHVREKLDRREASEQPSAHTFVPPPVEELKLDLDARPSFTRDDAPRTKAYPDVRREKRKNPAVAAKLFRWVVSIVAIVVIGALAIRYWKSDDPIEATPVTQSIDSAGGNLKSELEATFPILQGAKLPACYRSGDHFLYYDANKNPVVVRSIAQVPEKLRDGVSCVRPTH